MKIRARVLFPAFVLQAVFTYPGFAQTIYHMRDFYPTPPDKVLHFRHYLQSAMEANVIDKWSADPTNFTFTLHRVYYPEGGNWQQYWCQTGRIDDVMRWEGKKLYYSDTYNFYYDPDPDHTVLTPAHIWAEEEMSVTTQFPSQVLTHAAYVMAHNSCSNPTDGHLLHSHPYTHVWRGLAAETTDWSPYTGGPQAPVFVVRLDESTYFRDTPSAPYDNWFKEEWYFAYISSLGRYLPIHSIGYRHEPGGPVNVTWDMRLDSITDRP